MDKFLTFEGEQPIWLDDFNFMHDSVKDAINRVLQVIMRSNETNCILSGCDITYYPTRISWTEGLVLLSGEILPVAAGTVDNGGNQDMPIYFNIVETYDPQGERLFKNGEKHNCYQKRSATIRGTDDGNGYYVDEISRLETMIREDKRMLYQTLTGTRKGTQAELVHMFGGGVFIHGIFKDTQASISQGNSIIPKSNISDIKWDIKEGVTLGLMTYITSRGGASQFPIVITVSQEDGSLYLKVDLAQEMTVEAGEGQFYCRLNDLI